MELATNRGIDATRAAVSDEQAERLKRCNGCHNRCRERVLLNAIISRDDGRFEEPES